MRKRPKAEAGSGISVRVVRNRSGGYEGFTSIGHAGYAAYGKDIVCAAVSALILTTVNALEALAGESPAVVQNPKEGLLDCRFPDGLQEKGTLLLDAMLLGLREIEAAYGSKYLHIQVEEV